MRFRLEQVLPGAPAGDELEVRRPDLAGAPAASLVDDRATFPVQSQALNEAVIYFGTNSYSLRRSERTKLQSVNDVLNSSPGKLLVISGFCDKWGNAEYNLYLSKKRCQSVRSYLRRLGVAPERMIIEENGKEGTENEDGPSWKKRRVEFRLKDTPHFGGAEVISPSTFGTALHSNRAAGIQKQA